jgi:hypothetical protein
MKTFVIDSENSITVFGAGETVPETEGSEKFKTKDELQQVAEAWPVDRLVEIWNGIPGLTRLKKFTDRKTAVTRIWKAIQGMGGPGEQTADVTPDVVSKGKKARSAQKGAQVKHPRTTAKPSGKAKSAVGVREGSKTAKLLALLRQSKGATLGELMKATGWQAHSVRGFISGALRKKLGLTVDSTKREDGDRLYKIGR